MAAIKKRGSKSTPAISTASLPDIIFMLLFFFMVVTVLRDSELKIAIDTPAATQLTKLEKKSLVHTLYCGFPLDQYKKVYGTSPRLQLSDKIVENLAEIPLFVEQHRQKVPENQRNQIITSLKADGKVTMGIISDIKTELRKCNQLKVNYSAKDLGIN